MISEELLEVVRSLEWKRMKIMATSRIAIDWLWIRIGFMMLGVHRPQKHLHRCETVLQA
jgi:hypothetical protein